MIDDEELRATLADRERHAPDIDAVRREITGVNKSPDRWSGRGPILLAAAGVAAVAVLTAVVVVGARSSAPVAAPPSGVTASPTPSIATRASAAPTTAAPSVAPSTEPTGGAAVSVVTAYPGSAAGPVGGTTRLQFPGLTGDVAWNSTGDRLLITTWGNSCSPQRIERLTRTAPQQITLEVLPPVAGRVCPAIAELYTYEIVMPADISSALPLTVVVDGLQGVVPPTGSAPAVPVTRPFRSADVFGSRDPASVSVSARGFPLAQWAGDGRLFVTTQGSSGRGCERSITSVTLKGPQTISIGTGRVKDGTPVPTTAIVSCSADLAPLTSEIVLPDGIVSTEPVTIVLDGVSLELPPAP